MVGDNSEKKQAFLWLDDVVFDALGLTEDERKEVYRAVCRLVFNRISKAKG
jgi:hypothetical protein